MHGGTNAPPRSRARTAPFGGVLGVMLLLSACAGPDAGAGVPGLREEAAGAYVSGDSSIQVVAEAERGAPVSGLSGPTLSGEVADVADLAGEVVVLNVWGSWCAPCHSEAPELVAAEAQLNAGPGAGVPFVGINIRDRSVEAGLGFEEEYDISWPSLYDPDSLLLLRLADDIPPNVVPTTLVLDKQGRVAARLLGGVDTPTLVGVVAEVRGTGTRP